MGLFSFGFLFRSLPARGGRLRHHMHDGGEGRGREGKRGTKERDGDRGAGALRPAPPCSYRTAPLGPGPCMGSGPEPRQGRAREGANRARTRLGRAREGTGRARTRLRQNGQAGTPHVCGWDLDFIWGPGLRYKMRLVVGTGPHKIFDVSGVELATATSPTRLPRIAEFVRQLMGATPEIVVHTQGFTCGEDFGSRPFRPRWPSGVHSDACLRTMFVGFALPIQSPIYSYCAKCA